MSTRSFSFLDRIVGEIDSAIKVLATPARPRRPSPAAAGGAELVLTPAAAMLSARLMRVNHAGEVAAQALYNGQAMTARRPQVARAMRQAAAEENDHLAWCEERIRELGGSTSLLNPLWYAGSFAIGAAAGVLGDTTSLGFVAETERQVEAHLKNHLDRLPQEDSRSRAIVDQMTHDEAGHGAAATSLGGQELPSPLRLGMRLASRLMTFSAHWV